MNPMGAMRLMDAELDREGRLLAAICRQAIDEALLAHPGHPIEFERWDEGCGDWDPARLLEMVRNLLSNAIGHGAPGEPVIVSVIECKQEMLLAVASFGGHPIADPRSDDREGCNGSRTWYA